MSQKFAEEFLPELIDSKQEQKNVEENKENVCLAMDSKPRSNQEPQKIWIRKVESITPHDRGLKEWLVQV